MQADTEGAARVARLAARFNWSWTRAGVEQFFRELGWQFEIVANVGVVLRTGLSIAEPHGHALIDVDFFSRNGISGAEVKELVIHLTDIVDDAAPGGRRFLVDAFVEIADLLSRELGAPIGRVNVDDPEIVWSLSKSVIFLSMDSQVRLRIVNPEYQRWLDDISLDDDDDDDDEWDPSTVVAPPSTWGELATALTLTLSRLPIDGDLRVSTSRGSEISFTMGAIKLTGRIFSGPDKWAQRQLADRGEARLFEFGWSRSRVHSGSGWERTAKWPARYQEYESMAESAVAVLQDVLMVESPTALQFEAWISESNAVPDTSAFSMYSSE